MPQRSFSVFGVGHMPKICTPSCTARCMTVYLIYRGEKVVEVVRKIARVKFVHDFTQFKAINVIQLKKVELHIQWCYLCPKRAVCHCSNYLVV